MKNLVIIGNGFDLAHELRTSYQHYVEFVIDSKNKTPNLFNDLLKANSQNKFPSLIELKNMVTSKTGQIPNSHRSYFENMFFRHAFEDMVTNWCDMERLYYEKLISISKNETNIWSKPKAFHKDFDQIKSSLELYLENEQSRFKETTVYRDFFNRLQQTENNLILNFNYTSTVSKYNINHKRIPIIHIHGELKKHENPIIFGYAANDKESRELINIGDPDYMRNIKKHCYKRTSNEKRLIAYLEENHDIDVIVLGHSCGSSDKLILNQIFNHKNTRSINVFYYNSYESFYQTQVNIDRIMDNDENFKKLVDFQSSIRMPQFSDTPEQFSDFQQYITKMLEQQKARKTPRKPQQPKARVA